MNSCNLKNHIANCFSIELGHLWLFFFAVNLTISVPVCPLKLYVKVWLLMRPTTRNQFKKINIILMHKQLAFC